MIDPLAHIQAGNAVLLKMLQEDEVRDANMANRQQDLFNLVRQLMNEIHLYQTQVLNLQERVSDLERERKSPT